VVYTINCCNNQLMKGIEVMTTEDTEEMAHWASSINHFTNLAEQNGLGEAAAKIMRDRANDDPREIVRALRELTRGLGALDPTEATAAFARKKHPLQSFSDFFNRAGRAFFGMPNKPIRPSKRAAHDAMFKPAPVEESPKPTSLFSDALATHVWNRFNRKA
jgi:hypothetical protein